MHFLTCWRIYNKNWCLFKFDIENLMLKIVSVLPAGILQGLFFSVELPQYVNFASIGYIIGHEVTHGFDDQVITTHGSFVSPITLLLVFPIVCGVEATPSISRVKSQNILTYIYNFVEKCIGVQILHLNFLVH